MTLLADFDAAWTRLDSLVRRLDARQLTEIRDPAGWAAKDHLMHVAKWEQALLASADGRPRHAALGTDPSTDGSEDYDAINDAIFKATRDRSLAEVLETLRATHATTRARVQAATTAGTPAGDALLKDLPGYVEHYDQHRGWIEELVGVRL